MLSDRDHNLPPLRKQFDQQRSISRDKVVEGDSLELRQKGSVESTIAQDLQEAIHYHLQKINEVTRKTSLINDEYANFKIELDEILREFDGLKTSVDDNIVKKKVKTMSLIGKKNSAQVRINQILKDIDELKKKIDDWRIDECHFTSSLAHNRRKLLDRESSIELAREHIEKTNERTSTVD